MTFKKVRSEKYNDQNCNLDEYIHEETGLRHFHLNSKFPEKVFCLSVPTPPEDDTGMPHILEHFTLSGSRKYPVKDPFSAMTKRTVAHDMNASTARLYTQYYFATTLDKDFENLSDMYADWVFNPLLRQTDFEQEGWRFEVNEDNEASLKGVVLNEMKGVYANPYASLWDYLFETAAPNTPLARSSGGHPINIPYLEYPRLLDFHSRYYRPSKAVLSTSGDIDIDALHSRLEETIKDHLAHAKEPLDQAVPAPEDAIMKRFEETSDGLKIAKIPGTSGNMPFICLTYTKDAPIGPEEELKEQILFEALFKSEKSLVVQLEQELGCSISLIDYEESSLVNNKTTFFVVFEGLDASRANEIQQRFEETLSKIASNGLDPSQWEGVCSNLLKSLKKSVSESKKSLTMGIAKSAIFNIDPIKDSDNLNILEKLSVNLPTNEEVYLFCKQYLDSSQPVIVLEQDSEVLNHWEEIEQKTVEKMVESNREPRNKIEDNSEQDISHLPTLLNSDINLSAKEKPLYEEVSKEHGLSYLAVDAPSSATVRIGCYLDTSGLDLNNEESMLLGSYLSVLPSLGSANKGYEEQLGYENKFGVSINASSMILEDVNNNSKSIVIFNSSALIENGNELIKCLIERMNSPAMFEKEHFRVLMMGCLESEKNKINDRIVNLSQLKSKAPFSQTSAHNAQYIEYALNERLSFLENAINNPEEVYKKMVDVFNKISNAPRYIVVNGKFEHAKAYAENISSKMSEFKTVPSLRDFGNVNYNTPDVAQLSANPAALMVNHCYRSFPGPKCNTKDAAAVKVALKLAYPKMHEYVREIGGAYGYMSSLSNMVISLSSYRDPNFEKTYENFDKLGEVLNDCLKQKDEDAMNSAKISMYRGFLSPKNDMEKASKFSSNILSNITFEEEFEAIKKIGDVTWEDVERVTKKYLTPDPSIVSDVAAVAQSKLSLKMK